NGNGFGTIHKETHEDIGYFCPPDQDPGYKIGDRNYKALAQMLPKSCLVFFDDSSQMFAIVREIHDGVEAWIYRADSPYYLLYRGRNPPLSSQAISNNFVGWFRDFMGRVVFEPLQTPSPPQLRKSKGYIVPFMPVRDWVPLYHGDTWQVYIGPLPNDPSRQGI